MMSESLAQYRGITPKSKETSSRKLDEGEKEATHDPSGPEGDIAPLPPGILSLDLKFLCGECATKLIIDARWQGRRLNCPNCGAPAVVPECSGMLRSPDEPEKNAAEPRVLPIVSQLTSAEIDFLSGQAT